MLNNVRSMCWCYPNVKDKPLEEHVKEAIKAFRKKFEGETPQILFGRGDEFKMDSIEGLSVKTSKLGPRHFVICVEEKDFFGG